MVVELRHRTSITLYESDEALEPLYHTTIGDIIHYADGSIKELKTMDDVSAWLKEWFSGDRRWKYDGRRNFTRKE